MDVYLIYMLTFFRKAISSDELSRHCRRATRGTEETTENIEQLLLSLANAKDPLGMPLFKKEIGDIWDEQKRHVKCIQDPDEIALYTVTGRITKGGVSLPVYRCARGSTSLESFHLHLARFIPGTAANAINFQAFLLDGISRWNFSRCTASIDQTEATPVRTFDVRMQSKINELSRAVYGEEIFKNVQTPMDYTGELFGVQYLFDQSGQTMSLTSENIDEEIDDGFVDDFDLREATPDPDVYVEAQDCDIEEQDDDETEDGENEDESECEVEKDDESCDARGIPGWEKVERLAAALVDLDGLAVSNTRAQQIKALYNDLTEYDKKPITFRTRLVKPQRGRFARTKRSGHVTLEAMKR